MHTKPNLSAAPQVCLRSTVGEIVPPQIWQKWFPGACPPLFRFSSSLYQDSPWFGKVEVNGGTLCYSFRSILVKYQDGQLLGKTWPLRIDRHNESGGETQFDARSSGTDDVAPPLRCSAIAAGWWRRKWNYSNGYPHLQWHWLQLHYIATITHFWWPKWPSIK